MNVWVEMHAFANGIHRGVRVPDHDIIEAARRAGMDVDAMIASVQDRLGAESAMRVLAERFALTHDAVRLALLGLVFHWGQNDFQPQHVPSVSVGDVIRVKTIDAYGNETGLRRFAVMPAGFREIPVEMEIPHDGGMWAYRL